MLRDTSDGVRHALSTRSCGSCSRPAECRVLGAGAVLAEGRRWAPATAATQVPDAYRERFVTGHLAIRELWQLASAEGLGAMEAA